MNKKFDYTAQIENYLEGNMSGDEMKSFESSLQKDPALQSELQFQKDIINSLKEFRKTELKARLDQVNVGSYSGISTGLKIALTIALSASIGLGIYYFSNDDTAIENQTNTEQAEENIIPAIEPSNAIENEPNSLEGDENEIENSEPSTAVEEKRKDIAKNEKSAPKEKMVTVVTPSVIESFENDEVLEENETEIDAPKNKLENKTEEESLSAVEIKSEGEYANTFHYKFYNSKLYLYGDFKNIPYEIIEFNTVSGKSLYLYYQGSFYYLELNQMEVSPLQKINEEKLIEELDSLRVRK